MGGENLWVNIEETDGSRHNIETNRASIRLVNVTHGSILSTQSLHSSWSFPVNTFHINFVGVIRSVFSCNRQNEYGMY